MSFFYSVLPLVFSFSLISIVFIHTKHVGIVLLWSAKDIRFNIIFYECSVTSDDPSQFCADLHIIALFFNRLDEKKISFWMTFYCCYWMHGYYDTRNAWYILKCACLTVGLMDVKKNVSLVQTAYIVDDEINRNELSRFEPAKLIETLTNKPFIRLFFFMILRNFVGMVLSPAWNWHWTSSGHFRLSILYILSWNCEPINNIYVQIVHVKLWNKRKSTKCQTDQQSSLH